jgi:hypothetical protein
MALDVGMSQPSSWVRTSITVAGVALSLAVLVAAGGLWRRSLHHADLVARVEPVAGSHDSELTGVGSYKGAVLIGSIKDPPAVLSSTEYAHSVFPVSKEKGTFLHVEPEYKHGKFGFGVSRGELRLSLPVPILFWMKPPPPSQYRVVYVPYYFFMLLGVIHPARVGWRRWRGVPVSGPADQPLRVEQAGVTI